MFQLSHFHHFHQEPSRSRALCHTEESEEMVCDMVSQWPSGIGEKNAYYRRKSESRKMPPLSSDNLAILAMQLQVLGKYGKACCQDISKKLQVSPFALLCKLASA